MTALERQYADDRRLRGRIDLHAQYSTNPLGWHRWLMQQLPLAPGARLLEVGCGNGRLWLEGAEMLPAGCQLTLTDLSPGMVDAARHALNGRVKAAFLAADAAHLPFPDGSFDLVLAASMLYHVPDIPAALREMRRVLAPSGYLVCATYGEGGLSGFMQETLARFGAEHRVNTRFTLENAPAQLRPFFRELQQRDYEDALLIPDEDALLMYMQSLTAMSDRRDLPWDEIAAHLRGLCKPEPLRIPKAYGIFLCRP